MKMSIFIVTVFLFSWGNAAQILGVFLAPFKSHFAYNEAIMKKLHSVGHNITIISAFESSEPTTNYTVINWGNSSFSTQGGDLLNEYNEKTVWHTLTEAVDLLKDICVSILDMKEIQDALTSNDKKYDLLFVEIIPSFECVTPIAEKWNIPIIGTVAVRYYEVGDRSIGNPHNPAVIPFLDFYLTKHMNFEQRLKSLYGYCMFETFDKLLLQPALADIHRNYIPDSGCHLKKKPDLIFYNNHPIFLPRPLAPNAIEISGIHLKPVKPLPKDIEKFIKEAEHGTIFFSFGSIVRDVRMGPDTVAKFVEVFRIIPQRVIWKTTEQIDGLPANVLISDWWPQRDILAHQNVKAFITHCGQAGLYEAIDSAIPLIMMPFFGDQQSNAAILEEEGVGVVLHWNTITKEEILNAITVITNNTVYQERMSKLSYVFRDRPMSPSETVIYWTEYILRYKGAAYLRTVGADMPLYQYLLLDIISFLLFIVVALTFLIFLFFKLVCNNCICHKKEDQDSFNNRKKYS